METYNNTTEKKSGIWSFRMTTQRVAILGVFLALLVSFKWILGFVPGIEVVTFTFAMLGLFLPILDLLLLLVSFVLLVVVMYGFGTWELMYFPIFGCASLIPYTFKRVFKNRYVFALFLFIQGFSVLAWYFLSDIMFFDYAYAVGNIITAIPINLVEGFSNMLIGIIIGPPLAVIFNKSKNTFWPQVPDFNFNPVKHRILNLVWIIIAPIISIGSIVSLFIFNDKFFEWKRSTMPNNNLLKNGTPNKGYLLTTQDYNAIYKKLDEDDIALVLIVNKRRYVHIQDHGVGHMAKEFMNNKDFAFSYANYPLMGRFILSAYVNKKVISPAKTGPFIWYQHKYSNFGISNIKLKMHDIIEISYDSKTGPETLPFGPYKIIKPNFKK